MHKKNHIVLLVLVSDFVLFVIFAITWLLNEVNEGASILILTLSYVLPSIMLSPFILKLNGFSSRQKTKWIAYILFCSFAGFLHFYIRFKNEIDHIARETDQKMKDGPRSLSEFNSSTDG